MIIYIFNFLILINYDLLNSNLIVLYIKNFIIITN